MRATSPAAITSGSPPVCTTRPPLTVTVEHVAGRPVPKALGLLLAADRDRQARG